jgi:hypothetical protein
MLRTVSFFVVGLALFVLGLVLGFGAVAAGMLGNPMAPALGLLCLMSIGTGFACFASMGEH